MANAHLMNKKVRPKPEEYPLQVSNKFAEQKVDLQKTPLFFPEGFENIFLTIYFITIPYITGILFLFLYASEGNTELFLSVNEFSSFIVTWAIGYEILAVLGILYIIKMAISFSTAKHKKTSFIRP